MSRNAIKSINTIFDMLYENIVEDDIYRVKKANRYIEPNQQYSESNIEVLKESTLGNKIQVHFNTQISGVIYNNRAFVIMPGLSSLKEDFSLGIIENVLTDETISEGLKLVAFSEGLVPIIKSEDLSINLVDKIFDYEPNNGKVKYSINNIECFFENFEVWETDIEKFDIKKENDLYRIYSTYQLKKALVGDNDSLVVLNFYQDTSEYILDLLMDLNSQYISDVVYRAITSTHWEHCFLEFYRCIENLYVIYHIDALASQLTDDASKIAKGLESIGFRSPERTDVQKLFAQLSVSIAMLKELKEFLNDKQAKKEDDKGDINDKLKEKIADKFYDIRCSIAHLKYSHNHPNFSEEDWNKFIKTISVVIKELYQIYGRCLSDIIEIDNN